MSTDHNQKAFYCRIGEDHEEEVEESRLPHPKCRRTLPSSWKDTIVANNKIDDCTSSDHESVTDDDKYQQSDEDKPQSIESNIDPALYSVKRISDKQRAQLHSTNVSKKAMLSLNNSMTSSTLSDAFETFKNTPKNCKGRVVYHDEDGVPRTRRPPSKLQIKLGYDVTRADEYNQLQVC